MDPFSNVIEPEVLRTVPPHCGVVGVLASVIPLGKVSVKLIPDKAGLLLLFCMVKVNVLV
jgi:hypothetical protein